MNLKVNDIERIKAACMSNGLLQESTFRVNGNELILSADHWGSRNLNALIGIVDRIGCQFLVINSVEILIYKL